MLPFILGHLDVVHERCTLTQLILLLPAAVEICHRHHAGGQPALPSAGALSDGFLAGFVANTLGVVNVLSR